MEIIKRIWNYFIKRHKVDEFKESLRKYNQATIDELKRSPVFKPAPQEEVPGRNYRHKMSFRKQQLVGKTYNTGKDRFRIHERISVANKFKYYIELLT